MLLIAFAASGVELLAYMFPAGVCIRQLAGVLIPQMAGVSARQLAG